MPAGSRIPHIPFEEAWNRGDYSNLDRVFAPDCVPQAKGPVPYDVAEQIDLVDRHKRAFPEVHFEILRLIQADDQVAMHVRLTGTRSGEYAGHAPTGRTVTVDEMLIMRLDDGRAKEIWDVYDTYAEFRQLGFI